MKMWKWSTLLKIAAVSTVAALIGHSQAKFHKLPNGGEIKAVLIAGSNGWGNYRHQADICHAYQILRGNGIPEENIIVMMYDDIAFNEENPNQGVIINRPNGPNVYKNVKKDYVGDDVNKKVFFDVLLGNKEAVKGIGSGRVLESGPNDHVFINFVDHGNPGVLCLPYEIIQASELLKVLEKMAETSRYQKMFIYIETCFSGSVANVIPANLNIFVMTAANAIQSSWSCFDYTNPLPPLGGEFDVKWMRDAETADLRKKSVQQQFLKVRDETIESTVSEYGDIELSNTKLSEVIGYREQPMPYYQIKCEFLVPQHQVPVVILERRIQAAVDQEEKKKLAKELQDLQQARSDMVQFFLKLAEELLFPANMDLYQDTISKDSDLTETNLPCYENAVTHLDDRCFKISDDPFVGTQFHILVNLCNLVSEAQLVEKIQSMCHGKSISQAIL